MSLDHSRYYFGRGISPEDLSVTSPALFFTRWITHLCAPIFFLLAGLSIWLSQSRRQNRSGLTTQIAVRGVWLILLELTVVGFGWSFNPGHSVAGVIFALGFAMIFVASLATLPSWIALVTGAAIIACHNLLDHVPDRAFGTAAFIWHFLHVPWQVMLPNGGRYFVLFPLIPWIGVSALGYGLGPLMQRTLRTRQLAFAAAGAAMLALFATLRGLNLYANPISPSISGAAGTYRPPAGTDFMYRVIAFLDVEKYPPSFQYLLMTLGVSFIVLAILHHYDRPDVIQGRPIQWLRLFGTVPLFFYLIHIPLIHGMALATALFDGQPAKWLGWGGTFPNATASGYGFTLTGVYIATASALVLLFFPCRWFSELKTKRGNWWLSFL